jgi:hypothetical protein
VKELGHAAVKGEVAGVAGVAGAAVMTAGEKLEQRLTGRPSSYVPGRTLANLFGLERPNEHRFARNMALHGGRHARHAPRRDVGGELARSHASLMHTPVRLSTDQRLENLVGVGAPPWTWPRDELVVDVLHKGVYSLATGAMADRLVAPLAKSSARGAYVAARDGCRAARASPTVSGASFGCAGMSGVRRDLPDLDALGRDGAARGRDDLVGHGPGSVLGIEDEHRRALVALKPDPVAGNEARRLRDTRHNFLPQIVQSLLDIVDGGSHDYCVHVVPPFGARQRLTLFLCGRRRSLCQHIAEHEPAPGEVFAELAEDAARFGLRAIDRTVIDLETMRAPHERPTTRRTLLSSGRTFEPPVDAAHESTRAIPGW